MASFKKVETAIVDAKYEGRIKVYLESAEDVSILGDRWFSDKLDKLRFVSAENEESGGGGCQAVIAKVKEALQQNIRAFGIIDRDFLLSTGDLNLFWEMDDDKFHATKPYGDHIYILRRWELENYLLRPDAIYNEIRRRLLREPSFGVSIDTIFQYSTDIIQITALTTFSITNGKTIDQNFGFELSGTELTEKINKYLHKNYTNPKDIDRHFEKIRCFDVDNKTSEERWERISRILDGKKSLRILCGRLAKDFNIPGMTHWQEVRGCLANNIASNGLIDKELKNLIDEISSTSLA